MDSQDKRQPANAPRPQPASAPAVPKELLAKRPAMPKELLSARPAMTRVVPRRPEHVNQPAKPTTKPEPTPEEIAEREERLAYLRSLRDRERNPKKGTGKKVLVTLLVLLVLAGLGAGAYWFLSKPAANQPTASTQPQQTQQQAQTPTAAQTPATQDMKDYQSTNFAVSLKYPSNWTVSDTKERLTITSTQQSLAGPNGDKINGQVVVTIRSKQTSLDEFKAGSAVAVLDSKKLSYTQPAAGQRGSTFVSYLQYAKTTVKGTLDAMYVTGNAGYQKGQTVPQADVVKVDPLITVSFTQCPTGASCATNSPATGVQADAWTSSDLNKTVEAILQSLAIS